ncbi:hypothetical protein TZ53_07345 [Sphingobium sp. YBL2]|nr:hypothetical protein TZ53_07345 [Sphingobium sp. YBL2]
MTVASLMVRFIRSTWVSPWMVRLGEAMLDTVRLADHVKAHLTREGGVPVAGLLSELDAVIGSDMLGTVRNFVCGEA